MSFGTEFGDRFQEQLPHQFRVWIKELFMFTDDNSQIVLLREPGAERLDVFARKEQQCAGIAATTGDIGKEISSRH